MKAIIRRGPRLVCDELDEPQPAQGQVLLKSLACGICGSDLHALHHAGRVAAMLRRMGFVDVLDDERDLVLGHEFCGEVLAYGPDTPKSVVEGKHVVAMPIAIGPKAIETIGFSNRFPGAYAERFIATAATLIEVPNGLSPRQAAMVEPMAVGIHGVAQARLEPDSVAMVIGCGPIGLAVIAALKARNVTPIIAADFSPARRKLAEQIGADVVVDPRSESPHEQWAHFEVPPSLAEHSMARLSGRSLRKTVVFECVGVPGVLRGLIEAVPPETQIVVLGACMEPDQLEPIVALNKQINLSFASFYTPAEFALALQRVAEGVTDVNPMITGVVGRSEVAQAFEALRDPETQTKIIIEPGRD